VICEWKIPKTNNNQLGISSTTTIPKFTSLGQIRSSTNPQHPAASKKKMNKRIMILLSKAQTPVK